jgi:hypothetical protein
MTDTPITQEEMTEIYQELPYVQRGIERFGDGFMRGLAVAMQSADIHNLRKIRNAWPSEWAQYLEMGQK